MTSQPLRLEALKLAHETAHKVGGFSTMHIYRNENNDECLEKDINDMFKLADMYLEYLEGKDG